MTIDYQSAYRAVEVVLKNEEGRNTVASSAKCGAIASVSTFGAAILLGPVGILAGAVAGGTLAYVGYRKKFKSIFEVITEDFTYEEKEKLIENVQEFIEKFSITDAVMLMNFAQGNVNFQKQMLLLLEQFVKEWQENQKVGLQNVRYKQC